MYPKSAKIHLHFVFYFNNSVKCPCNVIHDSVTLIFTFLIIIIIIQQSRISKFEGREGKEEALPWLQALNPALLPRSVDVHQNSDILT